MLTKLSSVFAALFLGGTTLVAVMATPAAADPPCNETGPRSAGCGASVTVPIPGSSGGSGGSGGGGNLTDGPGNGCGAIAGVGTCPIGPPPEAPPPPQDPAILAMDARDSLELPVPKIHTSPSPRTYVRLPTGLWLEPGAFTSPSATAAVPGQTVTATATARQNHVVWDMVEGKVICEGLGSPDSTACSYRYQRSSDHQPGSRYKITVSITWNIHWECQGNCPPNQLEGDLAPLTPPVSSLMLRVSEIQNVTQPG
jgi:hypothetical protein